MSEAQQKNLKIALVGSPNSGKTTLYNWLTLSKFKTVNYPGSTVEFAVGQLASHWNLTPSDQFPKAEVQIIDTPGTYSLEAKSADEEVTRQVLMGKSILSTPDVLICVIDATQLSRGLGLFLQLKNAFPEKVLMLALTMSDLLKKEGRSTDIAVLSKELQCQVHLIDGLLGAGIQGLVSGFLNLPSSIKNNSTDTFTDQDHRPMIDRQEALRIASLCQKKVPKAGLGWTAQLDRVLLHPVLGILFFALIMFGLFASVFWVATPFVDAIDQGFGFLIEKSQGWTSEYPLISSFISNGLIASLGSVLVFVPQIFILALGIAILEGTGYLSRAAAVIDSPFSKVGLSGRSFIPVLSAFACAVPALLATRSMNSSREKKIAQFIVPLMTCSARLPVFALLLTFLYMGEPAWKPAMALTGLYFSAIAIGALAAWVLNRILPQMEMPHLMLDLPVYRKPRIKIIFSEAGRKAFSYIQRAGPPIFVFSLLLWMGITFPNYQSEPTEQINSSYLGQFGKWIEPVFEPMGVDWRVGIALLAAFAAREVFVSSLALVMNFTSDVEFDMEGLLTTMKSAVKADGTALFTAPSVIGLCLFFVIALQCLSTVGMVVKESNSWKFAALQLAVFNAVAYAIAVFVYQVGSL